VAGNRRDRLLTINQGLLAIVLAQQSLRHHLWCNPIHAVWLPWLYARFVPGIIHCLSIMGKNDNPRNLISKVGSYYALMGICMGMLWFGKHHLLQPLNQVCRGHCQHNHGDAAGNGRDLGANPVHRDIGALEHLRV
jgi:hypothetical protein